MIFIRILVLHYNTICNVFHAQTRFWINNNLLKCLFWNFCLSHLIGCPKAPNCFSIGKFSALCTYIPKLSNTLLYTSQIFIHRAADIEETVLVRNLDALLEKPKPSSWIVLNITIKRSKHNHISQSQVVPVECKRGNRCFFVDVPLTWAPSSRKFFVLILLTWIYIIYYQTF